jgi:hypothetical protein
LGERSDYYSELHDYGWETGWYIWACDNQQWGYRDGAQRQRLDGGVVMTLRLNGATSGYVELDAPAVAGTTSLTLPLTGFGKVLQVVYGSTTTTTTSTNNTFSDTTLTASITPSSTSSKVLVLVSQNGCYKSSAAANTGMTLKLVRGSTDLITFAQNLGFTGTTIVLYPGSAAVAYLDSPATTSSTTYKTQQCSSLNTSSVLTQADNTASTIILLEIGA